MGAEQVYVIRTPENVSFSYELAGLPSRAAAWGIDVLVMSVLVTFCAFALTPFAPLLGELASAALIVAGFLVVWWYSALCEWGLSGRTVGKLAVRLRSIDASGRPLSFTQAVIRNLVRIVDLLPGLYLVGGVSAWVDAHGRRLGDVAAGTVVIRERRAPRPGSLVRPAERERAAARDPALLDAAQRVTPAERDALLALCMRRERLPLNVRLELFERMAAHLERRYGLARPPTLSPEKLVLYVTTAMLGSGRTERR